MKIFKKWWFWVIVIIAIALVWYFSQTKVHTPPKTAAAPAAPAANPQPQTP